MWDLLIEGGYVLTMEGPGVGFLQDAAIGVRNGVIGYVGPKSELPSRQCHKYIDATGHVVMPGLINAHAHTGSCIIRGVGQDIYNWMQRGIWPFSQHMTRDDAVVGSLLNIVEAVLVGTTCFCDFADRMSELLPNYVMVGARARVAHTINEMPTDSAKFQVGELYRFDPAVGQRKLQDSIKMLEEWHGRENGRITCLVGPQGPDMMSLELLMECREVAKRYDTMIHMHVAQGDREINQMLKRYGKRSIQFLDELGYLDDRLMAVHLTEATPEETKIVAERGASMILCSASIAVIDGIVPPIAEFLKWSDKAALGSDQTPGNNCCNMFNEMKFTALLNKCALRDPTVFPAWRVLRLATIDSARAIGLGDEIGSLKPGKRADIILVDATRPAMSPVLLDPVRNIVPNLVYSANGSEVDTVIVDGRVIVEEGRLLTVDVKEVVRKAQAAADSLSARVKGSDLIEDSPLAQLTKKGYM